MDTIMMTSVSEKRTNFKVIIAGGSVAGLSLAKMLQLNNIDFMVLEAYPDIAPQVGASIGLMPNGLRVLDQLGLYGNIKELVEPLDSFHFRNSAGVVLGQHKGVAQSFHERHGYPMLFLDRQMVLQVLYNSIEDKNKVMTKKRVCGIEHREDGVVVTTSDGSTYNGDIVVGADGIHSAVRSEMWRIADSISPGFIPVDEPTAMPCDYSCIFGISNPCAGIKGGSAHSVFREHSSYLVLGGLNDRVYWFFFFNLGKRVHSPDIPRYTKEDEGKLLADHFNDHILPDLTFGEMYARKISSTLTALPEYVFRRWYFRRIMTIGDASHKFEPISGHGGNAALETSAVLTNRLVRALDESDSGTLSTDQLHQIFAEVQKTRFERVKNIIADAHAQQRVEALESPLEKLTALYLLPMADTEAVLLNASRNVPGGQRLEMVMNPIKHRLIPFYDDLERMPTSRGYKGWLAALSFLILSAFGYYAMHVWPANAGFDIGMKEAFAGNLFLQNHQMKTRYTGIATLDRCLTRLTSLFMPGVAGWDPSLQLLQIYFLLSLFPLLAVWSVEACRKRNTMALISFTSVWAIYQLYGLAVIAPLFYIAYLKVSDEHYYWWPLNRQVPNKYARTLLPALVLGYLIPSLFMFFASSDPDVIQWFIAFWQPSPIYVNILLLIFSTVYSQSSADDNSTIAADKEAPDMPYLRQLYGFSFCLSLVLHSATILVLAGSANSNLTVSKTFLPNSSSTPVSMIDGLQAIWLSDFWIWSIATMVWCFISVWDIQRAGLSDLNVGTAIPIIILGSLLIGPGAVLSACWHWREAAMARTLIPSKGN